MFKLDKHESAISNVNQRIERHGDERQLAADVKFTLSAGNDLLDSIDPELKKALFRRPSKGEQQDIPGIGQALTAVKFPNLEPQRLSIELTGYELEIDNQLDIGESIVLVDVKLKKFVIEPKEGGSVELSFTASANVDADEIAELSEALVRENVRLTATPPRAQAEHQKAA